MTDDDQLQAEARAAIERDLRPRTAPAGWHVDPHEHDVQRPEMYEPARRDDYPPDVLSQAARVRNNADNGSPHVMLRLTCGSCRRGATFYGREDRAPEREGWRCDRCTVPANNP